MVRDSMTIFRRDVGLAVRNPTWLLIGVLQPLVYLVLFGPLLVKVVDSTPGFPAGNAWTVLTPGLILMTATFGGAFASGGLLVEYRMGVLNRFLVTPISGGAILLGKILAIAAQSLLQAIFLVAIVLVAFDLNTTAGGVLVSLVIVFLLSAVLAAGSYGLALRLKNEAALPPLLNIVLMPLMLLSGILIPVTPQLAPAWLIGIARFNPFYYVVNALRSSFRGDLLQPVILGGCTCLLLLAVLTFLWGVRNLAALADR